MGLAHELVASSLPPPEYLGHDNYSRRGEEEMCVLGSRRCLSDRRPASRNLVRRLTPTRDNHRFMYSQGSSRHQGHRPQGADHDAYAHGCGDVETATGFGSLGRDGCTDQLGDVDVDGTSQSDRLVRRGRSGGGVPWDIDHRKRCGGEISTTRMVADSRRGMGVFLSRWRMNDDGNRA